MQEILAWFVFALLMFFIGLPCLGWMNKDYEKDYWEYLEDGLDLVIRVAVVGALCALFVWSAGTIMQ